MKQSLSKVLKKAKFEKQEQELQVEKRKLESEIYLQQAHLVKKLEQIEKLKFQ